MYLIRGSCIQDFDSNSIVNKINSFEVYEDLFFSLQYDLTPASQSIRLIERGQALNYLTHYWHEAKQPTGRVQKAFDVFWKEHSYLDLKKQKTKILIKITTQLSQIYSIQYYNPDWVYPLFLTFCQFLVHLTFSFWSTQIIPFWLLNFGSIEVIFFGHVNNIFWVSLLTPFKILIKYFLN